MTNANENPWHMASVAVHYGHHDSACVHVLECDEARIVYAAALMLRRDPAWSDPEVRACLGFPMGDRRPSWRRLKRRRPILWFALRSSPEALTATVPRFGARAWRSAPPDMRRAVVSALRQVPERIAGVIAVTGHAPDIWRIAAQRPDLASAYIRALGAHRWRRLPPHERRTMTRVFDARSVIGVFEIIGNDAADLLTADSRLALMHLKMIGEDAWRRAPAQARFRFARTVAWTSADIKEAATIVRDCPAFWRGVAPQLRTTLRLGVADIAAITAVAGFVPQIWRMAQATEQGVCAFLTALGARRWAQTPPAARQAVLRRLAATNAMDATLAMIVGAPSSFWKDGRPPQSILNAAFHAPPLWWHDLSDNARRACLEAAWQDVDMALAATRIIGDHERSWRLVRNDATRVGAYVLAIGAARWKRLPTARRRTILRRWRRLIARLSPAERQSNLLDAAAASAAVIGFHAFVWQCVAVSPAHAAQYVTHLGAAVRTKLSDAASAALLAHGRWRSEHAPLLTAVIGLHPAVWNLAAHHSQHALACLRVAKERGLLDPDAPDVQQSIAHAAWEPPDAIAALAIMQRHHETLWATCCEWPRLALRYVWTLAHCCIAPPLDAARRLLNAIAPPPPLTPWTILPLTALYGWNDAFLPVLAQAEWSPLMARCWADIVRRRTSSAFSLGALWHISGWTTIDPSSQGGNVGDNDTA